MLESMKAAAAAVCGTGHEYAGIPCQDSAVWLEGTEAVCIVLCDGAGSYGRADEASDAVAGALCCAFGDNFSDWYEMDDDRLRHGLISEAERAVCGRDPELSAVCTLLLFAAAYDGRHIWCHIGDGYIFGSSKEGSDVISYPENGGEPDITYFLSDQDADEHLFISRKLPDETDTVMLCSDGAGVSLYSIREKRVAPAVDILASWIRRTPTDGADDLLSRELYKLFRQNTSDDVSIAILRYPAAGQNGY